MNKKELVLQIKRMAETSEALTKEAAPPPPPPPVAAPAKPAAGPTPGYTGSKGAPTGNAAPAIKKMQAAMQSFAATVTKYSSKPALVGGKKTTVIDDQKKPFNDFITEQYLATSDVKGQEFTADPTKVQKAEKQPTDLIEMDIVIDTLKRIGSPKSELVADNVWDWRTNNALKNISAFAEALVRLSADFGKTTAKSFNQLDAEKLKNLIPTQKDPSKDLSPEQKNELANSITPLINKLGDFYEYYVKAIATNPGYIGYISKGYKLYEAKGGAGDPAAKTEVEQKGMKKLDQLYLHNVTLPGKKGPINVGNLPLAFLQGPDYIRSLMVNYLQYDQEEVNNPELQKKILDALINHVNSVLANYSTNWKKPGYEATVFD